MEIKQRYKAPNFFGFLRKLKRKPKLTLLVLIVLIIPGLAFILGVYGYKTGWVSQTVRDVRKVSLIGNYFSGLAKPEKMAIDIKFKSFQKLLYDKKAANEMGYLSTLEADNDYVPISMTYENKTVDGKARIKGNDADARASKRWSLRIKIKGDKTIMGMKVFSIHDPGVKEYMTEWLFHQLLNYCDLISLRYKFVEVTLNGENQGIYAIEENFEKRLIENNGFREGIILRFDEYWNYYFHFSQRLDNWEEYKNKFYSMAPIDAFETTRIAEDSTLNGQFSLAKNLLEAYRQGQLPVEKVFDINKIAKIFVITDLLGDHHTLEVRNIRFYFNPITSLIEPIGYDNHDGILKIGKLIGEGKQFTNGVKTGDFALWENSFFQDTLFYKTYIKYLREFSKSDFLDGFIRKIHNEYKHNIKLLYRNDYNFTDESLNIIKYNQGYIQRILKPLKGLEVYYSNFFNDSITIQISSFHPLPIEIKSITVAGKKILNNNFEGVVLDSKADYKLMKVKTFRIGLTPGLLSKETLDSLKVNCVILGLEDRISESIRHNYFYDEAFLKSDFIRYGPNVDEFKFLIKDEIKKTIQIEPGTHRLRRNVIIPPGYHVFCGPGVKLNMLNSAVLLSYSPLYFLGLKNDPIIVKSLDSLGQGIAVICSQDSSIFENVRFENLSNPSKTGWELTGALTFYESSVSFLNCSFHNNSMGDDYVNIIRSKFEIKNCLFTTIHADAVDCDFSAGSITDSKFFDCGNDAIDISGTQLKIANIFISHIGDKGLSIGERSSLTGSNIEINHSDKAVAGKDLSEITLDHIYLKECNIGFTVFQKKPEFGPAKIILTKSVLNNVKVPFLIEAKSQIISNGMLIPGDLENLKEILYKIKEE